MAESPTLRAGRGAPGAQPGTIPTESQFTRNINAMNRLADKLDGFIRVSRRIYEATVALDGKIVAHGEQLVNVSKAHTAATEAHIGEIRAVARELRATTRALARLAEAIGRSASAVPNPPSEERSKPEKSAGKTPAGNNAPRLTRTSGKKR